jgi:adenosylhomocysteine nucleosidase
VTATEVTERLLGAHDVDHVVVVGIAGAVDPDIAIGTVVVPEVVIDGTTEAELRPVPLGGASPNGTIRTSDEFVANDARLTELRARGVVAVDMETGSIGAVCERHGRPWSVFRAISDRAGDTGLNDVALSLAHPDGSPNMAAVAKFFVTRPWDIPKLLQLGRDAKLASDNAAKAAVDALTRS